MSLLEATDDPYLIEDSSCAFRCIQRLLQVGYEVTSLTCYRIRAGRFGPGVGGLDAVVDLETEDVSTSNFISEGDFEARLYLHDSQPSTVSWAGFVRAGFPEALIRQAAGPAALLVVRLIDTPAGLAGDFGFAFSFGSTGRFLLKPDSYVRGFGLRTALNLIYPKGATSASRLRAIDTKRRGATTTRARVQASEQTEFETFDVNRLRDLVNKAAGSPQNQDRWGSRLTGSDSLNLTVDDPFDGLGNLCRAIDDAYALPDYRDQFDWIDQVRPITDPGLRSELDSLLVDRLISGQTAGLAIAPGDIIDWDRIATFRYSFDRLRRGKGSAVAHPDIRLSDYLQGLSNNGVLAGLTPERLRGLHIYAQDGDETAIHTWTAWECIVGEIQYNGETYIVDEGEFFAVRKDYLSDLDAAISSIPLSTLALPSSTPTQREDIYNALAAQNPNVMLLDRRTVKINTKTTPIEICDLLTSDQKLIHVKRHLGSSDLSHLYAQGVVSACLLQESTEFRKLAIDKINEVGGTGHSFDFIDPSTFTPSDFEVVYAIAERWKGRTFTQALPFFSKINLREAATNLHGRGFKVSLHQIPC